MSSSITASASAGSATPTPASGRGPQLSADLGTFLKLLTTQLRSQDPTSPMDTEKMTQQLVQFASVEQQMAGNSTLTQLLELQQAGQLAGSADLVGRRVTLETETLPLQGGRAEVTLPRAGRAQQAVLEVRDAAGSVVRTATLPLGAAPTSWTWDGRDARGQQRPDGAYRVTVSGRGSDGAATPVTFGVTGLVTGTVRQDGALMLRLGPASVGFDRLREVIGGG
jgi:flagellar basal-body rod modification protein FlgD